MTYQQSVDLLARLSQHFGIDTPNLQLYLSEASLYHQPSNTIWLASHPWRGTIDSILHEFAHALADKTMPSPEHHGRAFQDALLRVVTFYYGKPEQYGWHSEYVS